MLPFKIHCYSSLSRELALRHCGDTLGTPPGVSASECVYQIQPMVRLNDKDRVTREPGSISLSEILPKTALQGRRKYGKGDAASRSLLREQQLHT